MEGHREARVLDHGFGFKGWQHRWLERGRKALEKQVICIFAWFSDDPKGPRKEGKEKEEVGYGPYLGSGGISSLEVHLPSKRHWRILPMEVFFQPGFFLDGNMGCWVMGWSNRPSHHIYVKIACAFIYIKTIHTKKNSFFHDSYAQK